MTAAHCVDPNDHETIGLSPIVYCGIHDRRKAEDDQVGSFEFLSDRAKRAVSAQVFDAIAGYVHPKWTGSVAHGHDVAVLKLDGDANLTLPRLGSGHIFLNKGDYLAATGWGLNEDGRPANKLQVATHLAVVGQDKCKEIPQGVDSNSWICAGGLQEDTCRGHLGCHLLYLLMTSSICVVWQVTLAVH